MSINILEILNSGIGKQLIGEAGKMLGESDSGIQSAVGSMVPALLGGMMTKASTPQGAGDLFKMVQGLNLDTGSLGNIANLIGGAGGAGAMQSVGSGLLSSLLGGDKTNGLASALASVSGIKPASAASLLSLGTPLMMGAVKKLVSDGGLDAAGLTKTLLGQKSFLQGANVDPRITGALGFNSMSSMLGALPNATADVARTAAAATSTAAVASTSGLRRWLPWILGALALFLLWNWLSNRSKPEVVPAPAPVVEAPIAAPVVTPAVVTLPASVYFETGSAMIGDEGKATLAGAAAIVAAEGGNIALTGHTDKTGDAAANEELAKQRAVAVRDALMAQGVAESNIVMQPPMFVTGAVNDRAARRVDITRP
ncbi:MAG: OmpA family protein [Proteobacteria bacterium]|nr:OmpA family protein [Pseudomonadota bacterium]